MVQDAEFTNGQYVVMFDCRHPEILLAVNAALHETKVVAKNIGCLVRDQALKPVGRVTLKDVSSRTLYFQAADSTQLDSITLLPLLELARAYERKDEYELRRGFGGSHSPAECDGKFAFQRENFDFDYNDGLRKLIENLIVEARVHVIRYKQGRESITGQNLDCSDVSNELCQDTDLDFATQLYGFIHRVYFESFRESPGVSGWDCDVTGVVRYGVKYHRISGSAHRDYSFENNVGIFKCALGILRCAKGVKALSIDETFERFGR